jgi:hypothetical protein
VDVDWNINTCVLAIIKVSVMFDKATQRVADFYQNAFVAVQKLIAIETFGN